MLFFILTHSAQDDIIQVLQEKVESLFQETLDDFHKVLAVFLFFVFSDTAHHAELFEGCGALDGKQMQGLVR